jgi:KaiC/GvpD/RAD55 family RecA-like ATPase
MQTMDRRGVLAQALLKRSGTKKTGKTIAFKCPRHSDGTASAWLGDHQWGCSACGFTEHFDTLAGELGVTLPETTQRGLTLNEYADRKGLSLKVLAAAGVEQRIGKYGDAIVAIPYRDAQGAVIRTKMRTQKGTFWDRDGEGAPLYGQDVLAQAPITSPVIIVEGESDCHAAWQHAICAVGLPGASQWRSEYAPLLQGRDVYVWQEPDEGGATLVSAIAKDLPKAKVIREVTHQGDPVKDLCDLHQRVPDLIAFQKVWTDLQQRATPIGAEGPAVAFDSISGDTLLQLLDEKLAPIDAVPTMLPLWNLSCHGGGGGVGLARGWFVTIGANTGTGKSLIGLNLAHHAIEHGEVVTFLSLEMGRSELATRFLSIASGEPVVELEQGPRFSTDTYRRARHSVDAIRERTGGHLLVNRRPLSKLSDVTACIKHYHESFGSRYFVVDYLQLAWTANAHSINDRIELVAHQLRDLTHTLNVTMVALSQFNRQTSAARSERPVAQGLMGGSAIENDSHQVLLFDHSRYERQGEHANTFLIIDKNRHGGVCDIPIRWDYRTLRLEPRAHTIDEQEKEHGHLTKYGRLSR